MNLKNKSSSGADFGENGYVGYNGFDDYSDHPGGFGGKGGRSILAKNVAIVINLISGNNSVQLKGRIATLSN